jgi:hypothetical protein
MDRLKRPARWDVIRRVPVDDGGGLATMSSYIELIAERWDRVHQGELQFAGRALECWRLDRLLRARRDLLRAHDELWGTVSYALYTMNRYRETIAWLADWRERPHVEPYMLNNLFFSLQHLDRVEQSNEVLRRGLELPRHGEITMRFHIFAALDDLLSRKTESARKHLAYVQEDGLVSYTSICYRFAQELLPYQPGSPRRPFNGAVEIAVENFLKNNRGNPAARRLVQRACQLISGHNANIRANLWYFTHRHRLWLIAAGGGITALVMRWLQLE